MRAQFAKPPHSWLEEMEGDSSLQDERRRKLLPPHLQDKTELSPQLAVERRWLWESETERRGMEPNDPLDRLYPPHKRPLARMPKPVENDTFSYFSQSFQSDAAQTLSDGLKATWMVNYDTPASSADYLRAMVVDAAGNICVTGYSRTAGRSHYTTVKYNTAGVRQWIA
jgi:hypothetical protein